MTNDEILTNGTKEYAAVKYLLFRYLKGKCPMNDVEASISSAMDEWAKQFRASAEAGFEKLEYSDNELKRLYELVMDANRKPAQTFFTAGWLRNVAREIEIRIEK